MLDYNKKYDETSFHGQIFVTMVVACNQWWWWQLSGWWWQWWWWCYYLSSKMMLMMTSDWWWGVWMWEYFTGMITIIAMKSSSQSQLTFDCMRAATWGPNCLQSYLQRGSEASVLHRESFAGFCRHGFWNEQVCDLHVAPKSSLLSPRLSRSECRHNLLRAPRSHIALFDTQIDSIQCLNFAKNWFNSIFDSRLVS